MRFMMIVKSAENAGAPPKELMDAMAELSEKEMKAGAMVETGGLAPTAQGTRIRLSGGKLSVTDGPFTEAKEVFGGYAVFDLQSKKEAIEKTKLFMELHRQHWPEWEGETEVRQVFGPQDFDARACAPAGMAAKM
jgi:hypothetical protein